MVSYCLTNEVMISLLFPGLVCLSYYYPQIVFAWIILLLPLYIYSCTGSVAILVDLNFYYSYRIVLNFGGAKR